MFGFAKRFFAPKANPIGVDFGTDCLRLAQVRLDGKEYKLTAAASADVPSHVKQDPVARLAFFVETTRDLLAQGRFSGRDAVLALPAASMFIQHLRVGKMDEDETKKALPWEARGKLPIDPAAALLRHVIAGEIYHDQDPKNELIVFAAAREAVNQFLAAATRARLNVVGMNVEPKALVDCFRHIYRRKTDQDVTCCFVDIGCAATRAVIARGDQILFARCISVGGDHFNRAVAESLKIRFEDAKMLRIKLAAAQPSATEQRAVAAPPAESFALLPGLSTAEAPGNASLWRSESGPERREVQAPTLTEAEEDADQPPQRADDPQCKALAVHEACLQPLQKLVEELDLCRRYYETTFPGKPVDRLIFVGGEARQRGLCQQMARQLGLAAQVGDPLVRMGRTSEVGIESGIDRRQPQPGWAVAIGLSLGPLAVAKREVQ